MAASSKARSKKRPARPAGGEPGAPWWAAGGGTVASACALVVLLGAAVFGLERIRHHVLARPEYNPAISLELENPPDWVDREGWRSRILAAVEVPEEQLRFGGNLLRQVYDQILESGWVRSVSHVTQSMDGTLHITCEPDDYRRPIAMLLTRDGYVAVDRDGVRLPEVYDHVGEDSGWMRIVGVRADAPTPGTSFGEDSDAMAGVRIAALIFAQDFAPRITGIDVANFRGRRDARENHITLRTRDGGTIIWGSAIGEEIEELAPAEKIANIALYFKKGSPQAYADISVHRAGWITPAPPAVQTADGSLARDR